MNGLKCPKCFLIHPDNAKKCYCGHVFGAPVNSDIDVPVAIQGKNTVRKLKFHGKGFDLFSIFIVNILLTVLTLGVYYFWGKVKIKRYLYSQLEFDGDRFTFHGKGKELFIGGVIGIVIFAIFYGSQYLIETSGNKYFIAISLILSLIFFSLFPIIFILSRRYYLSRSSWRGIRFSFRGGIKQFYRVIAKGVLLTIVTFGLYSPILRNRMKQYFVENSYFGTRSFRYSGNGMDVFKHFAQTFFLYLPGTMIIIFLVIFLVGIILGFVIGKDLKTYSHVVAVIGSYISMYVVFFYFEFWFTKYVWNHTTFMDADFRLKIDFIPYLKLKTGNLFIYILTIGLGWPWVAVRNNKFITERLILEGNPDFETIRQQYEEASATGESVADVFDIAGFDLGF